MMEKVRTEGQSMPQIMLSDDVEIASLPSTGQSVRDNRTDERKTE